MNNKQDIIGTQISARDLLNKKGKIHSIEIEKINSEINTSNNFQFDPIGFINYYQFIKRVGFNDEQIIKTLSFFEEELGVVESIYLMEKDILGTNYFFITVYLI